MFGKAVEKMNQIYLVNSNTKNYGKVKFRSQIISSNENEGRIQNQK